jgi:uncharacterized membrane protein YhaH (DUF805 family)
VLGVAFLLALNPVRLGIILLLISRERPPQNLLAYWVGCLIVGIPTLLFPLMVLHFTPAFASVAQDLATSSTVRHIQVGLGVLVLSIAALMTMRFSARQRARVPAPDGNMPTLVADSNTENAISRLLSRAHDASTEGGSVIRRLLGRAHNAWENGSLWVALVIGIVFAPPADMVFFVLAIIMGSGAAIEAQISAAIAFVFGLNTVVEITLISYLATPAKTQVVLRRMHDLASTHRRKILVAMFAVIGIALVTNGMASV